MARLKVLLSAFACIPGRGSEPGLGWNVPLELARHDEVWVLTQEKHRDAIEKELARFPISNLHFVYYQLPYFVRRWDHAPGGGWKKQIYYYLWQLGAYREALRLHGEIAFDIARHVTFVVYWKPSLLSLLPIPFIWGPVGGGESTPAGFDADFGYRGRGYEASRNFFRWVGEHDPLVRLTARRSELALATTEETASRLRKLGCRDIRVMSQVGISDRELSHLHTEHSSIPGGRGTRFVSMGRLLHWKGFHLGLRAFAEASLPEDEYWIIGSGPESRNLKALAKELGISEQVRFEERVSRDEALARLDGSDVLVHPSLHESGGMVCLEAMALGLPVICLDVGGPAVQVTEYTGFRVATVKPAQTVSDLAVAMQRLSVDLPLRRRMGQNSIGRATEVFGWRNRSRRFADLHREVWSRWAN